MLKYVGNIAEITQAGRAEGVGTTWGVTEVPSIGRLHVREDVWGAFVMILVKLRQLSEKCRGQTFMTSGFIMMLMMDAASCYYLMNYIVTHAHAASQAAQRDHHSALLV